MRIKKLCPQPLFFIIQTIIYIMALVSCGTFLSGCKCISSWDGGGGESVWMRTELFFGLTTRDGAAIPRDKWRSFVDQNVSPRFPEGFTILPAQGRWVDRNQVMKSESSRVVVILYPAEKAFETDRNIKAVVREYIKQFDQESVLRGDAKEIVVFYTSSSPSATNKLIPSRSHVIKIQ